MAPYVRILRAALVLLLSMTLPTPIEAADPLPPARKPADQPRKIVLIAGPKSHGPVGNGIHDYPWSVKLLKVLLDNSNVRQKVNVEYHLEGGPKDWSTLDDADTIMVISDGRDGELYAEAPHLASEERVAQFARQMKRGCGFLTFHFSTFAPDKYAEQILSWSGGYFDWETDGKRQWHSAIATKDAEIAPASPQHPVLRGVRPFRMKEEFYYNLRFREGDSKLSPIFTVADLPGREPAGRIVAWAREREDGGRGFGTTCGHFYDNWKNEDFRRAILNAIVWSAGLDVPNEGVDSRFFSHAEITAAVAGRKGTEPAIVDDEPIRVLLPAGNEAHKWHNWEKTTVAMKAALEMDPRVRVDVTNDIEDLGKRDLSQYHVILQNYVNWHDPKTLSDASRKAFVRFLENGGGLILPHFSASAFHFSLPMAETSDWPEYRRIARRVWNHHGQGGQKSGHDAFGRFQVRVTELESPLTAGLRDFEIQDELYFRQAGGEPIEPLLTARSNVTGKDEPLAWTYTYGKGRIYQSLLGHSEKTYDVFEPREMLRRAVAWASHRRVVGLTPADDPRPAPGSPNAAAPPGARPATLTLTEGRFGKALDASAGGVTAGDQPEYRTAPLTVECWTRLTDKTGYNILVAQETKASPTHWELFTMTGDGTLTVYVPGMSPDHVRSTVNLCDDQWHFVTMQFDGNRIRLFIDGKPVANQEVAWKNADAAKTAAGRKSNPHGGFAIGRLVEGGIGCRGRLDDVRLSSGLRDAAVPESPLPIDKATLGLWRFDSAEDAKDSKSTPDDSPRKNHATAAVARPAAATSGGPDHFGVASVGFSWTEKDSVDNRWNRTEIGPFLSSIVPLNGLPPVRKGLSVRLDADGKTSACYDTATGGMRSAWTGGFLKFDPARFGLISPPQRDGSPLFETGEGAGWSPGPVRYRGLHLHQNRVVLEYEVAGTRVRESPWAIRQGESTGILRTVEVAPSPSEVTQTLFTSANGVRFREIDGVRIACFEQAGRAVAVALAKPSDGELQLSSAATLVWRFPPREKLAHGRIVVAARSEKELMAFAALVNAAPPTLGLQQLSLPAQGRWTKPLSTRGQLGREDGSYTIDTLTLPFENPWNALFFCSGHDVFSNGDLAVCTVHGDVWRVSGVDERLESLQWKRYATGLFQPLGLKIVDDRVHVLGRDQITRLHDENGDGEADFYECFHQGIATSPGGHDYVACLETDRAGHFYYVHATTGLVQVSADGTESTVVATGFRNPNGLGIGPRDEITVAPQEGNWTPASSVIGVRPGGYYGFGGPKVLPERPQGYDPPLLWLPRMQDNSGGGQCWVAGTRWGPLENRLLHFSYGKCQAMLIVTDDEQGRVAERPLAAAAVDFPLEFDSGVMRGRFHPRDGQLYVTGLRGWVSSAVRDGCLQRVRFTGQAVDLPMQLKPFRNGLLLRFSQPLEKAAAEDPENYRIQAWNYRYSADYGSADWKLSEPTQEGREDWLVRSATSVDEGRAVFLEIPTIQPAMQFSIGYSLRSADARAIRQSLNGTLHDLGSARFDEARIVRRTSSESLPEELTRALKPGIVRRTIATAENEEPSPSTRVVRLINANSSDTASATVWEGYLKASLRGRLEFSAEGSGRLRLRINGKTVLSGEGELARDVGAAELKSGFNAIEARWTPSPEAGRGFRLFWQGDDFTAEPIPPTALFHDSRDAGVQRDRQSSQGRELLAEWQCARCHQLPESVAAAVKDDTEWAAAPRLTQAGQRLRRDWIRRWLMAPDALRPQSRMPRLLAGDESVRQRQANDLAAFLSPEETPPSPQREPDDELVVRGRLAYEDLGCIACHHFEKPDVRDEYDRIPLIEVAAKFQTGALEAFVRRPQAHRPGTRMPWFELTDEEWGQLVASLLSEARRLKESEPMGNATRGKELFRSLGCRNCHERDDVAAAFPIRNWPEAGDAAIRRGCLAEPSAERGRAPQFRMEDSEREALHAALTAAARRSDAEDQVADRLVERLRCVACHPRDGVQSLRMPILLEESERGLVPETLPNLTWAGEKLRQEWLEQIFTGKAERARPWLRGRMPAFPAYAKVLASGLAASHGVDGSSQESPPVNVEMARTGRILAQKDALDCRQCHAEGREPATGDKATLIAQGINFDLVGSRINADFYRRFLLDPPRYDIGARMPKLSADGRSTKVTQILDGDARRQFEALWHYLRQTHR